MSGVQMPGEARRAQILQSLELEELWTGYHEGWELNSGPLQVQQQLSDTNYLQPQSKDFKLWFFFNLLVVGKFRYK